MNDVEFMYLVFTRMQVTVTVCNCDLCCCVCVTLSSANYSPACLSLGSLSDSVNDTWPLSNGDGGDRIYNYDDDVNSSTKCFRSSCKVKEDEEETRRRRKGNFTIKRIDRHQSLRPISHLVPALTQCTLVYFRSVFQVTISH